MSAVQTNWQTKSSHLNKIAWPVQHWLLVQISAGIDIQSSCLEEMELEQCCLAAAPSEADSVLCRQ